MIKIRSLVELNCCGFKIVGEDSIRCDEYLKIFRYLLLNKETGVLWSPLSGVVGVAEKFRGIE